MSKLSSDAYSAAFTAIFRSVKSLYPKFDIGKTLKAIISDWSDTQLRRLQMAVGEETASMLVKGCQVNFEMIDSH